MTIDWSRWKPKIGEEEDELADVKARFEALRAKYLKPQLSLIPQPTPLYQKPKELYTRGEELLGRGISKIPVLPKALKKISPAFEFISEKLEKPFASIITSPFSPSLPWKQGEGWLEHEKREYENWNAPTYIKGAAEFAMPLWWIPWLGWAGKGMKALGVGQKASRVLATATKGAKLGLPTSETLNKTLFGDNWFRNVAGWAENKPVLGAVAKTIGGESAFVRDIGEVLPQVFATDIKTGKMLAVTTKGAVPVTDVARREIVKRSVIYDMRHGYAGLELPQIQQLGNPQAVLQIDEAGRVLAAKPKTPNIGNGLTDVIENPNAFTYSTAEAKEMAFKAKEIIEDLWELGNKEGLEMTKFPRLGRLVKSKRVDVGGEVVEDISRSGSRSDLGRHYKWMSEGINKGIVYDTDVLRAMTATIDHTFRRIAEKRFGDELKKVSLDIPNLIKSGLASRVVANIEPDLMEKVAESAAKAGAAKYALDTVTRLSSYKGVSIPGATMTKIRKALPDVADRIEDLLSIPVKNLDSLLSGMTADLMRAGKITPREFKIVLAQFTKKPNRILMGELDDALQSISRNKTATQGILSKFYRGAIKEKKLEFNETLKNLREELKTTLSTAKDELKPNLNAIKQLVKEINENPELLGTGLARYKFHPAFKNRLFEKESVAFAEKILNEQSIRWLKQASNVSGVGRTLIAALDFSAPFIQGLVTLGRNPIAWVKAVGKQFEFFANPQNMYKYLAKPEIRAVAAERWFYGGSRSTFEFFEALAPLQRVVEKVPVVGKGLKAGIAQTYGRAEAAFTGFGEAARNYMWMAMRKPNMTDDALRELARGVDRMTGVMSTEALAIGRNQQSFENAFVFFAPRYTRAGLALAGDILRGGMTGAQARTALGSMMASGMLYYYGISKILGQQPNLDPSSASFLTVKIGNDKIGVGGIFYGMSRTAMDVLATITSQGDKSPVDFVTISRFDNPFIKFMFNRTSPLTGLAVNAVMEHKNYFGEPLESPLDWGKFMAEKVLPIAMQRAILEPEHRDLGLFASEIMGGRTFPQSPWELREKEREKTSQEKHGVPYEMLSQLNKREIDKLPIISKFQEEIDISTTKRGKAISKAFLGWSREREDAKFMYVNHLNQLQKAYDDGMITGYDFKEQLQLAGNGLGATYEHINRNPQYAPVLEKMNEPKDMSKEYAGDVAYSELYGALYGNKFEDKYGLFDYNTYNQFKESLKQKYGDDVWAYVQSRQEQEREEFPPLAREYFKAKEVLTPYWQVQDKVEKAMGKRFAESPRGQAFIQKRRKMLRLTNPEIARYYAMFYSRA